MALEMLREGGWVPLRWRGKRRRWPRSRGFWFDAGVSLLVMMLNERCRLLFVMFCFVCDVSLFFRGFSCCGAALSSAGISLWLVPLPPSLPLSLSLSLALPATWLLYADPIRGRASSFPRKPEHVLSAALSGVKSSPPRTSSAAFSPATRRCPTAWPVSCPPDSAKSRRQDCGENRQQA